MAKKYIEKEESSELTVAQVNYVLQFANAMSGFGMYSPALTPMMINERMKDISLNQSQPTESTLTDAINNIKANERLLQSFSQDFEIQSQPYRRLLDYLGDMLAFDFTYVCTNATKEADYKTPKYRKDVDEVKRFFDRFDMKHEFGLVVKQLLRNEAFFCCPRFDSEKIVLQELPANPDYTLITGHWSFGLLFSFNLNWFALGGIDLKMYPDFFAQKYFEMMETIKRTGDTYKPSINPLLRGDSSWAYWQDIPVDVGWCWKMNPKTMTRAPYFTGLFLDLIQQPLMRSLQKSANMATAMKMVFGELPMLKDSGIKVRDQFALSADKLGHFLAVVKEAVGSAIKVATAPLQNTKGIDFRHEEKLYSQYLKTAMATSGVNSNLIFSNELKPNAIETQLSLNTDEQMMKSLYNQFSDFLDFHVNRLTKNYKFKFLLEGTNFYNDRERRFDSQMALADKGIVLPQKIAASIGISPVDFERQLEMARAENWVDKLTPIVPAFQQSASAGGRPQKKSGELTDSGDQTRADAGNVSRGGDV